jgi:hypothetical protein
MLRKLTLAAAFAMFFTGQAFAVCTTTSTAGFADAATITALNEICNYISGVTAPSDQHIGEVGNNQIDLTPASTLTNTAVAYTTGQSIGGLQTLNNAVRVSGANGAPGTGGMLQKIAIGSNVANAVQVDVIAFKANPTGSTCTNAAAYSLAAADKDKVFGVAHVTDWIASASAYVGQAQNLALPYTLASSTTIYACVVARGTITATGTTDFSLTLTVFR